MNIIITVFFRSEIDRLTSLLHSRTVDISGGTEEKRSEVDLVVSHDQKEEFPKTPVRENGTENHLISTPVVSSTVLDEDVASPAELAKAYMGSRPSKVSVSMLGSYNQVPRGDSALPSNRIFPSTSPTVSLMPRSSGQFGSLGNGFVTPRSRGRSAMYSMARTPYSSVSSATFFKGAGMASDAFGGPSSSSSSQSAWEQNRISGSRQGVLKRRSSVLDNDIGSIGPIRRIRQKSNLLASKTLSLHASAGRLSTHAAGTSSAGLDAPAENGDNSIPGTGFTPVPSKSSEMASKILQQLDKLVSPGEKSPTKLSPSILCGQALKSLENVDSSKLVENMHDSEKSSGSHTALPDIQDFVSHKHDKVKVNGSTTLVTLSNKSVPAANGVGTDSLMKDNNEPSVKAGDSTVLKSVVQLPQQKRQAFQMSAHEDYLYQDGDEYPNGGASATFGDERHRLDNYEMGSKSAAAEAKPSSLSDVKPIAYSAFNEKPDLRASDGSAVVENNAGTFPVAQLPTSSAPAAFLVSQSTSKSNKDASSGELRATSMLSFGVKVAPAKQTDAAAPTFGFTSTNIGDVSSGSGSSAVKPATRSDQKLENSSSFANIGPGTTNGLSDKTDKNTLNGIFRTPETAISSAVSTSTSAGSIFKFGASQSSSTLNNGSLASSPLLFSSPTPFLLPNNGQSSSSGSTNYMSFSTNSDTSAAAASTTATANVTVSNISSPSLEASVPPFTAVPVFKFATTGGPSTSVSTLSAISVEATEAKTQDTSSANVPTVPFGSTFAFSNSGNSIFDGTSTVTGTMSNTSGNSSSSGTSSIITNSGNVFFSNTFSALTSTGNGLFGGTSTTTVTSSSVFGGKSLSIASTGSSIFSSASAISSTGSNIFGFSAPAAAASASASASTTQNQGLNPFDAVSTQASAAGTAIGTSTQSMPTLFNSSASSTSFGLAGNTTFSSGSSMFGSSASVAKPSGSGATFGMSSASSETNYLSSSSAITSGAFGSNWQAPKTPIFGSSSLGFSFGSSASVAAPSSSPSIFGSSTGASSSPIFSFTPAAAVTPSPPVFGNTSPGMVFGATPSGSNDQMEDSMAEDMVQASPPTGSTFGQQAISPPTPGFVFGASNPPGASSFNLGAQPFQASGSLEFGAGGSFSLGSGGGDKSGRKFVKVRRQRKK
ncbi:hypothetical protein PTKIN_Ptkin16aG0070700 [Pterospermum kingtungense]